MKKTILFIRMINFMSGNLLGKQRHLFYVQFFKLDHWLTQKILVIPISN